MPQGKIKILSQKGFGIIEGEQSHIYFSEAVVDDTTFASLKQEQSVEYEAVKVGGRQEATSVRPI